MKRFALAALVAAALLPWRLDVTAAETTMFRHLVSVYADETGGTLNRPEGVACGSNGQFVVSDTGNGRLLRFSLQGSTVSGGAEIRIEELSAPSLLQLSSKDDIYALDGKQRRIVRLGPDGAFKGALALDGAPPPTTIVPKSFRVDAADNVYVLDTFSSRVLVFGPDGKFARALAIPDEAGFATDVATDVAGNVLVLDSIKRRIYSAAKDASNFVQLGKDFNDAMHTMPVYMTTGKGTVFVLEGAGSSIVTLGRDGTFLSRQLQEGWKEGSLNHPAQICVNDRDEAFVADRDNSRVQVFGLLR